MAQAKSSFILLTLIGFCYQSFCEQYNLSDWSIFLALTKLCLIRVLWHNENLYRSILVAHSEHINKTYNTKALLRNVNYQRKWTLCGALKVIRILFGQQSGYPNMLSFFVSGMICKKHTMEVNKLYATAKNNKNYKRVFNFK